MLLVLHRAHTLRLYSSRTYRRHSWCGRNRDSLRNVDLRIEIGPHDRASAAMRLCRALAGILIGPGPSGGARRRRHPFLGPGDIIVFFGAGAGVVAGAMGGARAALHYVRT